METDNDDICVEYLEKIGDYYQYPEPSEESWQNVTDIVCQLPNPEVHLSGTRIKCSFSLSSDQVKLLSGHKLKWKLKCNPFG